MMNLLNKLTLTKYLSITFDSNLTWKSHINELCLKLSKTTSFPGSLFCASIVVETTMEAEKRDPGNEVVSKTVGILSKVRYYVSKHIHYSLIYPFLTYGVHVWRLTFPTFLTQLFIIQKRALRIISFSEPKSHSEPLFKSLNLLKLNDVIESQILSFVYQWSHGLLPPCFSKYFNFTSSVHSYATRQSCNRNLYVASVNTTHAYAP